MSLGGGQDKLPVIFESGQIFVPTGGQPSTHILKPNVQEFPHSARNEALCLDLAREIGLPAANCELIPVNRGAFVAVERYDRMAGKRLHQIDFCQVLDIGRAEKYQREKTPQHYAGMPSLLQVCTRLKIEAPNGIAVPVFLWQAMLYSWFIKNTDAHAKNYSVIFYPDPGDGFRARLAPLYDMNSIYYYPYADQYMAMPYNGKFRHDSITSNDLVNTAACFGIDEKTAINDIIVMGNKIINILPGLANEHMKKYRDAPIYHKLKKAIICQTEKILESFAKK
ncbi:MAG: HipA domain-containing protein [Desulfovibrio sp.]|nr:HipA domain-containing protein [Desulfovibrio sp.]